ncbi:hypothetical protein Cfor_12745 [Coptotermes formosanus]|uniref:Trafficking protein particle complex subunit 12 n=1 Tax=Coptotermes formosanus TaxID=36987 RepID=A0A6L2PRE4_COPFO|nr:hypothetical protein Cfor_12745 [Coptotermes formosanus]
MNENNTKVDPERPSLSQYFSQTASTSLGASFFDEISSGSGPAMMTSIQESASSQDLFESANAPLNSTSTCPPTQTTATVTSTVITQESVYKPLASTGTVPETSTFTQVTGNTGSEPRDKMLDRDTKEEPVVCRIFSSQEAPPETNGKASGKSFFDMLGSGTMQTSQNTSSTSVASSLLGVDLMTPGLPTSSSASSMMTSPDFTTTTDGSFLTPSLPTTPTPTGDTMESVLNDDAFTKSSSSIHPSEADRRRDAWIPSERTRHALISAATSPPGTYFPERDLLTMPGVVLEEEMVDTVCEMVRHYLGEGEAAKRKVLTVNDVTQDERGLRELIQAGCFRAAINLTSRLLTIYGQGAGRAGHPSKHTVHSIQLWFTRLALHVKLRSFSLAEVESEPFGDLDHPDLYFQFYPELYGGRMGSMVPFAFRLLLAELPQYLTKHQEALNRLHVLLATVRKILRNLEAGLCEDGSPAELSPSDRNESRKLWATREARVLHSIVNCAVYQKDYSLAVQVLELLLSGREWGSHHKRALQSALGRVYLQLGDVAGAEKNFALAQELRQQQCGLSGGSVASDVRDLVDQGLMAVAQNAFQEAYDCFNKASTLDPSNIMLRNNMGVCLLYLGQLKEALALLEGAVNNNPTQGLHESLLLNVCTLYELESSYCNLKKLGMLNLLSRYKGDGVSLACLKLQM